MHRHRYCHHSDTGTLGSPNAHVQEVWCILHVQRWHWVRSFIMNPLKCDYRPNAYSCRILVITACRISAIHLLDPMNITYTAFTFGIYNLLETLLGIFNACLPVTRPVFQKVYNTDFFVWTRGSKESKPSSGGDSQKQWIWGLPKSRSTAHGSDKKKFQQLDEQFYPLSTIGTRNETSVGSWAGGNLGSTDLEAQSTDMDIIEPNDAIRVTRNWDIKSSANAQKR